MTAQVSLHCGVFSIMERAARDRGHLSVLESVRCLECSEVYSKPAEGGTVQQNPGCPNCGYIGWLSVSLPHEQPSGRRRSAAGPLRRPSVQSG